MKRFTIILILFLLSFNLFACNKYEDNTIKENIKKTFNLDEDIMDFDDEFNDLLRKANLTIWAVYWDMDIEKELKQYNEYIDAISYFAADFDSNNNVVFREKSKELFNKYKNNDKEKILSIVNDKILEDGSSIVKDNNILREIYGNEENIENHINNILKIATENNFDTVEIDYEQLKGDLDLWEKHLEFLKRLYSRLESLDIKMRVVLEPNLPIKELSFFEGPSYVMMCYNLHGGFSGPGEKTNVKFIQELINDMKLIPGRKDFAIPTGGFLWSDNGEIHQVTEKEAEENLIIFNGKKIRDYESNYIVIKYKDDKNIENEIWYADKYTLKKLSEPIIKAGYDISFWRIGG